MTAKHDRQPSWLLPMRTPARPQGGAKIDQLVSCRSAVTFKDGRSSFHMALPPLHDSEIQRACPPGERRQERRAELLRKRGWRPGAQSRSEGQQELLTANVAERVGRLMQKHRMVEKAEDGSEWARLCNLRRVAEVACVSVAAVEHSDPFQFDSGEVFTLNQAWVIEMSRLLHMASLKLALTPGFSDYSLCAKRPAVNQRSSTTQELVASCLPRAHRSIQTYLGLMVAESVTNDTMLPLQRRLTHKKRGALSFEHELNGWSGACTEDDLKLLGLSKTQALGLEDVPQFTLPWAAYSMHHDQQLSERRSTRLLSGKPKAASSYNPWLQAPRPSADYDKPEFVEARTTADGRTSDKMTTSWVREHAKASMEMRFIKPFEDGAEPAWCVWEDFDNNAASHLVGKMAALQRTVTQPWAPSANGQPSPLPGSKAVRKKRRADGSEFEGKLPKHELPLALLYGDVSDQQEGVFWSKHSSSLADTLLVDEARRAVSFREQTRELDVLAAKAEGAANEAEGAANEAEGAANEAEGAANEAEGAANEAARMDEDLDAGAPESARVARNADWLNGML
jgi:hypothetical protein